MNRTLECMRTVSASEIEYELENRARKDVDTGSPRFLDWLQGKDGGDMIALVAMAMRPWDIVMLQLKLSLLKNDYIAERKYQCDPVEWDQVADSLRVEPDYD